MPPLEDDDDSQSYRFPDREDDSVDEVELAPDDLAAIRCTRCKKWILEDSVRCPYCKEYQLDGKRSRKAVWFVVTVIVCILLFAGYLILGVFNMVGLHP